MKNLEQLFSLLTSNDPNNVELGKVLVETAGFSEKQLFEEAQLSQFGINSYDELAKVLGNELRVFRLAINDLRPLRLLSSLTSLNISNCPINSVEGLQHLHNLKHISLCKNGLEDISPLANLQQLETLSFLHNPLKDVSSLANLPRLERLHCVASRTEDYSGLKQIQTLKDLVVGCDIGIELGSLPDNVRTLSIEHTPIANLDAMLDNHQLKKLSIFYCKLPTLVDLPNFKALSYLNVEGNQLESIAEGSKLPNLTELKANDNKIKDLKGFKHNKLRVLDLNHNPLESLAGIEQLKNLEILHIKRTKITDLSPLLKLKKLRKLCCFGLAQEMVFEFDKQRPHIEIDMRSL